MTTKRQQPIDAAETLRSQSLDNQYLDRQATRPYPPEIRLAEDVIDRLPWPASLVARIQMVTGARAVEVLQIRWRDVHEGGWIYVSAKKGSASRAVYVGELLAQHPSIRRSPELFVFGALRYQQYYRLVKVAARSSLRRSRVRYRVTNLFRCAAAKLVQTLAEGAPEAAQHFLGHRSPRSTRYYLQSGG